MTKEEEKGHNYPVNEQTAKEIREAIKDLPGDHFKRAAKEYRQGGVMSLFAYIIRVDPKTGVYA